MLNCIHVTRIGVMSTSEYVVTLIIRVMSYIKSVLSYVTQKWMVSNISLDMFSITNVSPVTSTPLVWCQTHNECEGSHQPGDVTDNRSGVSKENEWIFTHSNESYTKHTSAICQSKMWEISQKPEVTSYITVGVTSLLRIWLSSHTMGVISHNLRDVTG